MVVPSEILLYVFIGAVSNQNFGTGVSYTAIEFDNK